MKKFTAVFAGELERREDFIEKKKKELQKRSLTFDLSKTSHSEKHESVQRAVHHGPQLTGAGCTTDFGLTASLKTMKKLHIPLFGFHFKCLMDRVLIRFTQ